MQVSDGNLAHAALPPLPVIDGHLFIDNSTLERFTTCARSYEYYGLHKRQLAEGKPALTFGKAVHAGLEAHYREEPIEKQMRSIQDVFVESPVPIDEYRNAAFANDVMAAYRTEHLAEPFEVLRAEDDKPLLEVPFAYELGSVEGITIMWTGRIDMMVRWDDGRCSHVDHKTTSRGGATFFDEFINDQAQLGYCWATRKALGKTCGFMINGLVCRAPTRTGKGLEFIRQRFDVTNDRIDEWQDNTMWIIHNLIAMHKHNMLPMETKWCCGKYGKCPYLDVCSVQRSSRLGLLYSNLYEPVTWSPLNQETKE